MNIQPEIIPLCVIGVGVPPSGDFVLLSAGRAPIIDDASTLNSPKVPSLAASLRIFNARFSVTMELNLRPRSTIKLPHLQAKKMVNY